MRPVERLRRFLGEDVWRAETDASPLRRVLVDGVRVAYMTAEGFSKDLCATRASALTFTTLLALVPVLALAFAVLRGLGWRGERLEALILGRVTLLSPEAIEMIVSYVDNINFTGLGVFGAVFLLVTFVSTVTSVESAFNAIWDDAPARTMGRRIVDYFGVMVVAPLLLVVAISLTAAMQSYAVFAWIRDRWAIGAALDWATSYAAWPVVWALFAFLYRFVPNTRVGIVPALVGGVVAGSAWQLTQWTYIRFQIGAANYDAIYGALAQLPLLMAWIYVSWLIVLLGAEIAHAVGNVQVYSRERRVATKSGQAFRDWVAMSIAFELARAALEDTEPPTQERLAQLVDVPLRTIRDVFCAFEAAGIGHCAPDTGLCYLSVSPEIVSVLRVLDAVRGVLPDDEEHPVAADSARRARALLEEIARYDARGFGRVSLKETVLTLGANGDGAPRDPRSEPSVRETARTDRLTDEA